MLEYSGPAKFMILQNSWRMSQMIYIGSRQCDGIGEYEDSPSNSE